MFVVLTLNPLLLPAITALFDAALFDPAAAAVVDAAALVLVLPAAAVAAAVAAVVYEKERGICTTEDDDGVLDVDTEGGRVVEMERV